MPVRYVVEPIDIDGDGIPDGDLVKQFDGTKLISQKFVPAKKLKEIVDHVAENSRNLPQGPKERVVYQRMPNAADATDKPIMVADATSFGQYLKAGFGAGAGATIGNHVADSLWNGLGDLFSMDGGKRRRK